MGVPDEHAGTAPSRLPGPPPERPACEPIPPLVITPTEQAYIRKMHSLGALMARTSKPIHTQTADWDSWSEESRAEITMLWQSQLDHIRRQIAETTNALSTLLFY